MIEKTRFEIKPERHPFFCQWEVTCRCNLRCVMCYTDCFNVPQMLRQELSTAEIFRIMDELRAEGTAEILFTGGEPMTRPDFLQIHERARTSGFLTTVFTNGTLIDERTADRLCEFPPNRVEISLHGTTKPTFESVTAGAGSFEKCLNGIRLLRERGIPLVLKTTAMTLNADEVLSVKKYAEEFGAAFKLGESMRPTLNGGDSPEAFGLPAERMARLMKADPALESEACAKDGARPSCRSGEKSFHIDAYGMLQLCSGNRARGFDLKKGSFREGFYEHLTGFHCSRKAPKPIALTVLAS